MGGYGSGRTGGRPTFESTATYKLSAKILRSIPHGIDCKASGKLTWGDEFELRYELDATQRPGPVFRVSHAMRDGYEREITYEIGMVSGSTRFGGRRWWWLCPNTGRRAFKLYLPNGGHRFLARHVYRLGYGCQRETRVDRLMRKARKLHRALGGDGGAIGAESPPPKPKWMRWKTYERKVAEWTEADVRADNAWGEDAIRRFGGLLFGR